MAEGIVFNIAKNILDVLSPQARQKIGELWGVKAELEKLQKIVFTIQAVLLHAEEQYHQSSQVKQWVVQLKDALYDAEDLLGDFNVESQLKDLRSQNKIMKEVRTFFSRSNQFVLSFKMASKLKEVRTKIDIIKDAHNLRLEERLMDREVMIATRRQENEHSFIPMKEIIGRDDDKREIGRLLLQDSVTNNNVSVISIVGIGGLGKTALAKCVLNEENVKKHFEPRMWVTVSDEFNIKNIVGKIIASAKDAERPEHLEMDQMQSRLRKEIDGKRYLLVLDDLWNENREEWHKLKMLLDGGGKGSKILITTRSLIVAQISGDIDPYFLKGLTTSESLDLFMQCASSEGQEISKSEKFHIGEEIVEKCCGVPLAIRVIGGMLFLKKTKAEWLHFKDNELQRIPQRENNLTVVLRISYDHLPSYLKQCFAFCSLLPKDFEIEKSTLTSLWVAQGFIQPSLGGGLDLEQMTHDSFMYLLHRGFFQDRDDDDLGNVITCKMHDLMHDLACQVAGIECDVMGPDSRGSLHDKTLRHLSYPSNKILLEKFSELQLQNMKLRTFLSTETDWWSDELFESKTLPELTCYKLMSSMKCLRALILYHTNMIEVPSCLCKLKLLSYLDLSGNKKLERLPKSIKSLQNLMTLILIGCSELKELPGDIGKLVKLTNLCLPRHLESMPRGLGKATSLRRLTLFVVREDSCKTRNCAKLSELGGLNNLRTELRIKMVGCIKNAAVESKSANLKGKQFLDALSLCWERTDEDNRQNEAEVITNHEALLEGLQPHANLRELVIDGYRGTILPRWMMEDKDITLCLPNLVEVRIYRCKKCQCLPPLGLLPHLKRLHLFDLDEVESIGISIGESSSTNLAAPSPSFPSLLELTIRECPKLKSMPSIIENVESLELNRVSVELVKQPFRLPRLRDLEIEGIKYLESLPDWVQHCTALQTLQISSCGECRNLPPLGLLPHLRRLHLFDLDEVESIGISIGESSSTNLAAPSPSFPSLLELTIRECPKLKSMPSIIENVESLELHRVSAELVKQLFRLPRLRYLEIEGVEYLESLPDWVQHCTALETLRIFTCKECRYLLPLGLLPHLKRLVLGFLDEVESIGISIGESSSTNLAAPSPSFPSLLELAIRGCPKLKSLPPIIENVERLGFYRVSAELVKQQFRLPRLRDLWIEGIEYLKSVPDWVQHCTALETLTIKGCKDLASLPESMTQLKSLRILEIWWCSPLLRERCEREIGEDWHKIKHIPRIQINRRFIAPRL